MPQGKEVIAWACWCYGKIMKHLILKPLYNYGCSILDLEMSIYRHTVKIRRHWDKYMYSKEAEGL